VIILICWAFFFSGCDPVGRHKVLSTIFDGVPTLPPPEQICEEYAVRKVAEMRDELSGKKAAGKEKAATGTESVHFPYEEKACDDCHDKNKADGLIRPKSQLCFVCHTDFIKGSFVHGPVAVGDCLACHVPHNSQYGPLLKVSKKDVCDTCHREIRTALGLHETARAHNLGCTDCHNPHYGNVRYLAK